MQIAAPAVSDVTVSSRRMFAFRGVLLLIFGLAEVGLVLFWYQVPYVTSSPLTFVLVNAPSTASSLMPLPPEAMTSQSMIGMPRPCAR